MNFHLIDLISQAFAIEAKFAGKSDTIILEWLQKQGRLYELERPLSEDKKIFRFCSFIGIETTFFLDRGKFIFIGDHYTFRPPKFPPQFFV